MYKSVEKNTPLSKIFNFFDPKFLHDFEGIVKYFSVRDFGVQYVHPQGTFVGFPFWPQNGDFGQNPPKFLGVPPGCTPPQNFRTPKVMTLGYIQHKYLTVTRKTRKDTLLQSLLISTLYFCVYDSG